MAILKNNPLIYSLLLITFFSMLAYLPLIPFMGFYSDDFFFGYVGHFYGSNGLIKSLVIDRPFNGYLLALNYVLLGLANHVLLWHIYIFLIRLVGGYTLFFALLKIWPRKLSTITFISLLFLIYPGFLQQTLPLGFGGWITTLTLWIFSFALTVFAIKNINRFKFILFTLIAVILQINSFLQLEFFIGLEVLRILIITLILKNKISLKTVKGTFMHWSPYMISLLIFILWRIFIFKSTREVTDIHWVAQTYYSNPLWILKIPIEIFSSFTQTVIFAYFVPIIINFIRIPLENSLVSILLGIGSAILLYFFYKKFQKEQYDRKKIGKQLFLIGLLSIFAALIPIIISGRLVRVYLVYDRYTITSIIGVGLIIVGFLLFKFSDATRKWILITLVSLSITSHLMNGFYRTNYWDKQKDLWWQLYWRTPNIQNNAMLILYFPPITEDVPFKEIINKVRWYRFYWAEEQIWTAGNLFFNYNNPPIDHFHGDFLRDKDILKKIKEKSVEEINNRNIIYSRDFKNSVIITTPSDTSCLWVLDNKRGEFPTNADELLISSIVYSDTDNLIGKKTPDIPPREIFGSEPAHGWCYYFQKASLARQLKDWSKLRKLKEEVTSKNLKPKDLSEWLPFTQDLR